MHNSHPSMWWPCSIVFNLVFQERVLSPSAKDSPQWEKHNMTNPATLYPQPKTFHHTKCSSLKQILFRMSCSFWQALSHGSLLCHLGLHAVSSDRKWMARFVKYTNISSVIHGTLPNVSIPYGFLLLAILPFLLWKTQEQTNLDWYGTDYLLSHAKRANFTQ